MIKDSGIFTQKLWEEAVSVFNNIISLPFYRQLSSGTLPEKVFRNFLEQDILYLKEDTKAIMITSEKAPRGRERDFFKKLSTAGIELEKSLHRELECTFGRSGSREMNTACREYCSFLTGTAEKRSYPEAASALLPCYWIYQNAGLRALETSVPCNPYSAWLDTYSGEEFTSYTEQFTGIVEAIAEREEEAVRAVMSGFFLEGVRHEYSFMKSIVL